jgi:hypothetical protein
MRTFLLGIVVLAACSAKHISGDDAQAACDHLTELGFWTGFEESIKKAGQDPKDPTVRAQGEQGLIDARKSDEWKAEVSKCADGFAESASQQQVTCIMAAKTSADGTACLK